MTKSYKFVVRTYSGRPGCMCGCRGKYSESERSKKLIFNKIMKHPNMKYDKGADCIYIENGPRNLVAYFS